MPINQPFNERELLVRIAADDGEAFGQLMRHYHARIYQTVLRISGDEWMAEEVVQDTFLKVWLKRNTLGAVVHFNAWLCTIAENLTFDAIRRAKRKKNTATDWIADFYLHTTTESQPDDSKLAETLQEAVDRLPARQKEAFQLIKMQGYKREEAARQMQISPETVKSHLDQAMRSVRAYCVAKTNGLPLAVFLALSVYA